MISLLRGVFCATRGARKYWRQSIAMSLLRMARLTETIHADKLLHKQLQSIDTALIAWADDGQAGMVTPTTAQSFHISDVRKPDFVSDISVMREVRLLSVVSLSSSEYSRLDRAHTQSRRCRCTKVVCLVVGEPHL